MTAPTNYYGKTEAIQELDNLKFFFLLLWLAPMVLKVRMTESWLT